MSGADPGGHRYAVFLRGINVGGLRLAMPDVAQALAGAGFTEVRTLLATGNAVLTAHTPDAAEVARRCGEALREAVGYGDWVLVKTPRQVAAIVDGYPFTAADDGVARHAYAVLATGPDTVAALAAAAPPSGGDDRWQAAGDVLYREVERGRTLDTELARVLGRARFRRETTTRNLNTLRKVLAALG